MNLIELKNVTKEYHTTKITTNAVRGVDLKIKEGEFVAIMGPSGSGKSTLMNIMGFLDVLSSGEYIFNGEKLTDIDPNSLALKRNKEIGFVFQSFYLLPRLTALENVCLPMVYAGVPEIEQKERGKKILKEVLMEHRANYRPTELSGGEQQRVAIARALANEPKIIFADEPTGNLDSKSSTEIMKILTKLNKSGRTIIMVTHSDETAKYAKRLISFKDGKIIGDKKI